MKKFVAGKVDEIPSEIIRILTEKETFIRDLVMRYPQWFSQDMGQIMEKELEDVLEEFREIPELESMVSDRVDALARARDLLLDFHSIIAERENIKQSFSIDSLLELVNRRNLPIISENQLKMMKSNFDLIKRDVDLLNFEYENFGRLIKDLEGYIWRLEVQGILRNKNSTPVPSQLYKMLRSCPDMECSAELRKLGKKLKIIVMDIKEARKAVVGWLSGEFNLQESRRSLERALVSDLTASPDVEEQVKIANKVLNNENKLTDSTTQKLIDFGYTNTKLVQKFLGKETLKKLAELDKADSIGVFRDDNVEEMIEEKVVIQPSVSSSAITPEKSIEVPVEESSPILKDKTSESVENMDIEEPEQKEEEIMEQESLVVAEEPLEEQAVEPEESERMIEEPIQEEEPEIVVDHFAIEVDNMEEMVEFTEYIIPTPESIIEEQVEAISEKIVEDQHISDEEDLKEPEPESDNDEIADQEAHEEAENCHEPETHHAIPEPEAPKVDQSEQKTSSGKKAKPLISFDEAVIYFRDYKKPETYSGTQDQFNETMTYINWAINQFKQRIELSKFTRIMGKLSHVVAIEVPDMKELQTTEARAVKLRDLALQMPNDELIAKREQIEAEYRSVQEIEIIELDMMFSEMDRDWQTSKDLKEAKETIDKKTLDQMIILKNRVDAARYYISKVDKFKVYDLFTIVLVNAWKIHDHDYGKPEIDYNTLKEVLIVIEEDNKEKDRHINPMNAEFAKNLYTSVRTEYKRIIDSLTIGTDQSITAQQSYKQFVDFTSKLMEFKNKMTKEEKGKKDDTSKLAFVLKPTLNKNKLNLLIDYELSVAQIDLVKPAFINRTTQHHRKYFLTMIKTHLESNLVFKLTHEKAFKRAAAIERDLFDNNLTKPAQYEHIGMQYINFMKPIKEYKYISLRLMSRKFKYDYLTRQMHVGVDQMPKWEAEYKKQYLLGKEVKIKREDVPANVQKPAILKYDPEETINRMMQEPIEGQDYPAPAEDSSLKPKYLLSRNIDIKVRQSALVNLDYLSYRIFEGDFTFARDGEATKTFSNIVLNALDSKENIMKAAEIPQNLCLSDKIAFNEFVKYMNSQVLSNFNSPDSPYLVHQGWVEKNEASTDIFDFTRKNGCTLAIQYSKNSKIFIFPLKCVPTNWLDHKEIWVTNPEIDLVYFIITKSVRGSNEKGIDPVGILIQGKYFKLMPKNSSASGSTFKEPADYSLNTHESRDKQKIVENFDSRFSKPKPVAGLLKAVKHFKEETHEKRPASNRFIRDDDLPSTYLGKRAAAPYQNNFLGETGEQNALASEYMSSAKLLKEAVQTSYDKILNDVTLQTSRKTNQALGAWPAGSESEKQANTSHQHLINFLTKQKGSSQNENKEPLDYLKDSSYRPQMSDLAKLGGFPKEPVDDRRMHLEERGFSYEHEVPEHRESTLKKAINAINKTKFKQGSTFYESPKLNEHPTLPSVFNGGGF